MKTVAEVLAHHRVIVCAGSGGVGKTTTAAALAVHGALQGRRTMVMTIDPARRLADALGLRTVGNEARAVDVPGPGSLTAMMLDQKGAWDALVERYAPSDEVRRRILANRFYQHLSESFAGSQEYMAVEQLAELHAGGAYDLIVVDTPPTRHALDFLDAPKRIAAFLDRRVVRWFVKPYFSAGWATLRVVNRAAGTLLRRLEEATGVSALMEISDFFTSMSGLFDGFEQRVQAVDKLLRARSTAFVLVATPEEQVLTEADDFCRQLAAMSIPLRAVVFNRVQHEAAADERRLDEEWLRALITRAVKQRERAARLVDNFLRYETQARGDHLRMEAFRRQLPGRPAIAAVPNFEEDLHDLDGLRRMLPHRLPTTPPGEGRDFSGVSDVSEALPRNSPVVTGLRACQACGARPGVGNDRHGALRAPGSHGGLPPRPSRIRTSWAKPRQDDATPAAGSARITVRPRRRVDRSRLARTFARPACSRRRSLQRSRHR